ncbi:Chymotrypsin-like serine proteinase [Meloidogyne graminicola]|uniref:Chymotrypsin-like serine proteinase n=1 Tax=Meloidogyne graminicola TaxID=189291 RepID=A0A8S9ZMA4_9BILA|nr:Chymotrypsin-like serine proteinase [Meloidogyne graminicola]
MKCLFYLFILFSILIFTFCNLNKIYDDCLNECGLSQSFFPDSEESEGHYRSFGGYASKINKTPFVGLIRGKIRDCNYRVFCTAIIIGPYHVLTAEHCLEVRVPVDHECYSEPLIVHSDAQNMSQHTNTLRRSEISLFVGITNINEIKETEAIRINKIIIKSRLIKNENIFDSNYTDIALLETKRKLHFNASIRPICLNKNFEETFGQMVYFTGFGQTNDKFNRPPISGDKVIDEGSLQTINIALSSPEFCKASDGSINNKNMYICAGTKLSGIDGGDSGGALYFYNKGRAFLLGIAASISSKSNNVNMTLTKKSLNRDLYPDTFTRTSSLCNWIETLSNIKCKNIEIEIKKECKERAFNFIKNDEYEEKIIFENRKDEGIIVSKSEKKKEDKKSWWDSLWG